MTNATACISCAHPLDADHAADSESFGYPTDLCYMCAEERREQDRMVLEASWERYPEY